MPTGYTAAVQDGTITEFREFALQCARAFGATITMRDDPMDKPIPDAFAPSDWHAKALERERKTLAELRTMSLDHAEREAKAHHEAALAEWKRRRAERQEQRLRYEAMLAEVRAWQPPSPDHVELKSFMERQLIDSIDFDCREHDEEEPKPITGPEWLAKRIKEAERMVAYHAKEHADEVERTESRNRWIWQLRQSLSAKESAMGRP